MPIIGIPTKAKDEYLRLCAEANALPADERAHAHKIARTYMSAIRDIFGIDVSGEIGMEADLALPDDGRAACLGIYLD